MALHLIETEAVRTACRQKLESCEAWLRRLVHDRLEGAFGANYLETASLANQSLFPNKTRLQVRGRLTAHPDRYSRPVDALLLDELSAVLCKQDAYSKFFATCFRPGFPAGREHLRSVLQRLVPIRNSLAHGNPITVHDAERILCYSDDIISTLTDHYANLGMAQEYNAPSFTRLVDSYGHVFLTIGTKSIASYQSEPLRLGDSLRLEVEVDAHYPPDTYRVDWVVYVNDGARLAGNSLQLTLQADHVGEHLLIEARLISSKPWHRHGTYDALVSVVYKVLPPP